VTTDTLTTDYRCDVELDAPPDAVYAALRAPEAWWWTDVEVGVEVGDLIRFRWAPGEHLDLRIEALVPDAAVDWTCVSQHDGNLPRPDEWLGTRLSFRLEATARGTRLSFVHHGLTPALECYGTCELGWDRFLRHSLKRLVETGRGLPLAPSIHRTDEETPMNATAALDVVRDYHRAWTEKDFDAAARCLAPDLDVEVPINEYGNAEEFMEAVRSFGGTVTRVDLLSELGGTDEAMLLYDLEVPGLGTLRVAEHFTVQDGIITRVRQIHDTAGIRAV
jgi:uncharacterized protein YndB with AHSA1/START domain